MTVPEQPDEFMTVAEVAAILKLNQQTVRNWIDGGTLPAVRIGRRVRIKRSDFDTVVEAAYSGRSDQGRQTEPSASVWDGEIQRYRRLRFSEGPPPFRIATAPRVQALFGGMGHSGRIRSGSSKISRNA